MKKLSILLAIIVMGSVASLSAEARSVRVGGSFRSNGSYVQPHYRTSPNSTKFDNWSAKGNFNPYTGKRGTVDPFRF